MSPIAIGLLAFGLSVDAFVAAIGRGATGQHPGFLRALRAGALFGAVEAITPLIGWGLGIAASHYVRAVDHWIAFALLAAVGGRMVLVAARRDPDAPVAGQATTWALLATAVGTSIDAMAVGVSLAVLEANIVVVAIAIGFATMAMSTTGMLAGRVLGRRFGQFAEISGGLLLVGLGVKILIEHLGAG